VTSLPASPSDGDECYFVADATNGVVWHLKYRAASASAYKWECVGGVGLFQFIATSESTGSTSWADLATVGPQVTIPLAGDYIAEFGAMLSNTPNVAVSWQMGLSIGGAAPIAPNVINVGTESAGGSTFATAISTTNRLTNLAAASLLKCQYQIINFTCTFASRYLRARPVRVG
jgi:hypothetical protein